MPAICLIALPTGQPFVLAIGLSAAKGLTFGTEAQSTGILHTIWGPKEHANPGFYLLNASKIL